MCLTCKIIGVHSTKLYPKCSSNIQLLSRAWRGSDLFFLYDMLAKKFRLTGKDVQYIVKQRSVYYTSHYAFFWIKQYPNKQFNQISVTLPRLLYRSAVARHWLKKRLCGHIQSTCDTNLMIWRSFKKVYVSTNKKKVTEITKNNTIPDADYLQKCFVQEREQFIKKNI